MTSPALETSEPARTRRRGRRRPPPSGAPLPGGVAVKPARVRPAWLAAGIAVIALFTVLGWAAFRANSTTVSVLGLRDTVVRGQTITANDLVAVNIAPDPQLRAVPASQLSTVVGQHAATDLPAGGIVPVGSFTDAPVPAQGRSIIGVLLKANAGPVTGLTTGAPVRLVALPGQATTATKTESSSAEAQTTGGVVVATTSSDDGSGTRVDIDVSSVDAPNLQLLSAQDRVAVVVDSQAR